MINKATHYIVKSIYIGLCLGSLFMMGSFLLFYLFHQVSITFINLPFFVCFSLLLCVVIFLLSNQKDFYGSLKQLLIGAVIIGSIVGAAEALVSIFLQVFNPPPIFGQCCFPQSAIAFGNKNIIQDHVGLGIFFTLLFLVSLFFNMMLSVGIAYITRWKIHI